MTFGFSTVGQPEVSFAEACALTEEFGLDFIELRALGGSLDLPGYFRAEAIAKMGKPVQVIGSSLRLISADQAALTQFIEFADLAARFECRYVRVFGGGVWGTPLTDEDFTRARSTVLECRAGIAERGLNVNLLLETHSAFCDSASCHRMNQELDQPLLILWDSHHTWRAGGESLADSWSQLRSWIRHIHYKDSVTANGPIDHRYVLPGKGEFPSGELLTLLEEADFQDGVSLEWEKAWHPELPPLRDAMVAFRKVIDRRS